MDLARGRFAGVIIEGTSRREEIDVVRIIRSPRGHRAPPVAPRRPDGGAYRFELIYDGANLRAYADKLEDLMEALIPGYGDLDGPARVVERLMLAVGAQVRLQAALCAELDMDACSPEEQDVLLGSREHPPAVQRWEAEVPLVLVESYYEPLGGLPRPESLPRGGGEPESNLIWIDPTSELSMLTSLSKAGLVNLASTDWGAIH